MLPTCPDYQWRDKFTKKDISYGVVLYEQGQIVDPSLDARFSSWESTEAWSDRTFTEQQLKKVLQALLDLTENHVET
eukprot:CAMPEP_0168512986 /NCGR_PEP_ID=MMETSP0405-20121227/3161_1 /TAXON_ID=498012 /ORGANISM="Trichosphaerium sp, Strain Am-I-7 wt" /LENGTH=76 /DNA_ID=CAMNT_0008531667 /DNA_START=70 /DNA_END=296 /DNA_ORIENTATION=+